MQKLFALFLLCFMVVGCAGPLRFPSGPTNAPQKKFSHTETFISKPKIIKHQGEELFVGNEIKQTFSQGLSEVKPKPSIFQRVMALGIGWVILMVLGMFFPPVALVMGVFNKGASKVTSKVVMNIEKALDKMPDPVAKKQFVDTLTENMDPATKEAVRKIKKGTFNKS